MLEYESHYCRCLTPPKMLVKDLVEMGILIYEILFLLLFVVYLTTISVAQIT
jgi:hypothetical protein